VAALDRNGQFRTDHLQAKLDQPMRLRSRVRSDDSLRAHHHVLVYDIRPRGREEIIARKILQNIDKRGSHVWVSWTPRTA
jgi:hypothetical protein